MKRIVVADDSQTMRNFLRRTLIRAGHEVVGEAEDGFQAVQLYEKFKPDLIIIDIIMPELSGIEVIKQILELDANAKLLICSSMGQNYYVREAIEAGAKDFIKKPFNPSDIIEIVNKY